MFIARSVLVTALLIQGAFIGAVTPSAAFEFNPSEAVSSTVLRSKGYDLKLSDGTIVKLTAATVAAQPQKDCFVHIPSVRQQIEGGLKQGSLQPLGVEQNLTLQVKQDPNTGALWCGGAGTGCTIVIK